MKKPHFGKAGAMLLGVGLFSALLAGCAETTPTPSPIPVTSSGPSAQPNGKPRIYDFWACTDPCPTAGGLLTFPAGTKSITISWRFENIPQGAHYVRTWTHQTKGVWKTYDCKWTGPATGDVTIRFFDRAGGLAGGTWTLTMTVDSQVLLQQKLVIEGDNPHWSAQEPIHACF